MTRRTELVSGCAALLCYVAVIGWLFCLSKINTDYSGMGVSFAPLCVYILAVYLINRAVMGRGLAVPVFVALQAALCAAAVFLFVKCSYLEPDGIFPIILGCILYAALVPVSAFMVFEPTNRGGVATRFDMLAAFMVILLFLDHFRPLIMLESSLVMCAVALFAQLLALVSESAEKKGGAVAASGSPLGGKLFVGCVVAVIAAAAGLVVSFASEGVYSFSQLCLRVIKAVSAGVKSAAVFLYGLVDSFFRWLSQFIEPAPAEPMEAQGQAVADADYMMEAGAEIPFWFYIVLGAIAVAVIVFIVFRLRKARVWTIRKTAVMYAPARRQSGFKEALLKGLRRFMSMIMFRVNCVRYRKTAPGLLAYCEKTARGEFSRQREESGEGFLLRLAGTRTGEEEKTALTALAGLVERSFYSAKPVTVPAEVYRSVRRVRSFKKLN